MTIVRGQLLDETTGDPVAPATPVEVRRISDDVLLDTVVTDADGYFEKVFNNGNPGPVYTEATLGGTTRKNSSLTTIPADTNDISALRYALSTFTSGVVFLFPGNNAGGGLLVTANGSNMIVTVATGAAVAYGLTHVQRATRQFTVPANASGVTRTDSIFLRFTYSGAEPGQTNVFYAENSTYPPQDSDVAQDAGFVDIPLALITVDNGVSSIALNKVTDTRRYASPQIRSGYIQSHQLASGVGTPNVENINIQQGGGALVVSTTALTTIFTDSVELPTGSWSGQVHYEFNAYKSNGDTVVLTAVWGGTTETYTYGDSSTFIPSIHGHIPINIENATGTIAVALRATFSNADSAHVIVGGRIYGTLVRTA